MSTAVLDSRTMSDTHEPPDTPPPAFGADPALIPRNRTVGAGTRGHYMTSRRKQLNQARDWAFNATLGDPKVRWRYSMGLKAGTLPPKIELYLLELGSGKPDNQSKRLLALLATVSEGQGLITMLTRRPMGEDPLAAPPAPKQIEATIIETTPIRESIVPPAKPKRKKSTAPPLQPGEEEMG